MKQFVTVYQYCVTVAIDEGVRFLTRKYKCTETTQNFIPQDFTNDDEKAGFFPHFGRIPKSEINVPNDRGINIIKLVTRHIYYIEGQKEEAEKKLNQKLTEEIYLLKIQTEKLWDLWSQQQPHN